MSSISTPSSNVAIVNVDLVLDLPHNFYHILSSSPFKPAIHTKESACSIALTDDISSESHTNLLNSGLLPKQCITNTITNIYVHTHNDGAISISFNTDLEYSFPPEMEFNVIAEHLGELGLPPEYSDSNFKFKDIIPTPGIKPEYGLDYNTHPNSTFTFKQVFTERSGEVLAEFIINEQSVAAAWSRMLLANPDNVNIEDSPTSLDLSAFSQLTLVGIKGEAGIILASLESSIDRNGDVRNLQDSAGNTNIYFHNIKPEDSQFISKNDLELSEDFLQKYHLNSKSIVTPPTTI